MRRAHGDERIRRGFLFFPRLVSEEWRWWERAAWEERYSVYWYGRTSPGWRPVRWVDETEGPETATLGGGQTSYIVYASPGDLWEEFRCYRITEEPQPSPHGDTP